MNKRFIKLIKISLSLFLIITISITYMYKPGREMVIYKSLNTFSFIKNIFHKNNDNLSSQDINDIQNQKILMQDQIKLLQEENKKLANELSFKIPLDTNKIALPMLGSRSKIYNSTYIKTDKSMNLYAGMYVYARENLSVGTIDAVYDNFSKISFLGEKNNFSVEILETGEIVELSASGLGLYYGKLPKSSNVENGQTIVLRGYPKSIVGNISLIEDDSTSLNTIWVRSPLNLLDIDIFYVNLE